MLKTYYVDFTLIDHETNERYPGMSRVEAEDKIHAINQVLDEWKDHPDKITIIQKVKNRD